MNQRTTTGLFAQGNYQLTDTFEVQVGGRYSTYKATGRGFVTIGRGIPGFPDEGVPVADLSGEHDDARFTGKVALNWKVDADNLLYALVARGYKPGGFNSTTSTFDPETVMSYEAGWKSSFFGERVRTQLSAFYNKYKGFQFNVVEPSTGFSGVENIADVTIKGFEGQVQARVRGFGFDANVAYVDSNLASVTFVNTRNLPAGTLGPHCGAGTPSNPPLCFDYNPFFQVSGEGPNLYAPKWTYNLGADYCIPVGGADSAGQLCLCRAAIHLSRLFAAQRPDRRARALVGARHARHGRPAGDGLWHQPDEQGLCQRPVQFERILRRAARISRAGQGRLLSVGSRVPRHAAPTR